MQVLQILSSSSDNAVSAASQLPGSTRETRLPPFLRVVARHVNGQKGTTAALVEPIAVAVDLDAGELKLPDTKTGGRAVPLAPSAVRLPTSLPRDDDNPWVIENAEAIIPH